MNLSVEGDEERGIEITPLTTLSEIRTEFPIPEEYCFGVPSAAEGGLPAMSFMPLVLLKLSDCKTSTLQATPLGVGVLGFRAVEAKNRQELEHLRSEVVQLRLELHSAQAQGASASRERDGLAEELKEATARQGELQAQAQREAAAAKRAATAAAEAAEVEAAAASKAAKAAQAREHATGSAREACEVATQRAEAAEAELARIRAQSGGGAAAARAQLLAPLGVVHAPTALRRELHELREAVGRLRTSAADDTMRLRTLLERHAAAVAKKAAAAAAAAAAAPAAAPPASAAAGSPLAAAAARGASPPPGSGFGQYVGLQRETASLQRDVHALALAGREFFVQPEGPAQQAAFCAALARVQEATARRREAIGREALADVAGAPAVTDGPPLGVGFGSPLPAPPAPPRTPGTLTPTRSLPGLHTGGSRGLPPPPPPGLGGLGDLPPRKPRPRGLPQQPQPAAGLADALWPTRSLAPPTMGRALR